MKKLLLSALLLIPVYAQADPLDEFQTRARSEYLTPFALDVGGLLGATGFHNGRALGFPGFELGVVGATQRRPDENNRILRDAGVDRFGIPLLHAAVGLPLNIDVVGHGLKTKDIGILGGGVRYGILKSGMLTKFMPNIGVSAFVDQVDHNAFNVRHYAANLGVGWDLPIIQPYVGVGVDWTRVRVEAANVPGLNGLTAWSRGGRWTAGADITPFPFLKAKVAMLVLHGIPGFEVGLGAKF
jgi:opacity protein-like surface antigen